MSRNRPFLWPLLAALAAGCVEDRAPHVTWSLDGGTSTGDLECLRLGADEVERKRSGFRSTLRGERFVCVAAFDPGTGGRISCDQPTAQGEAWCEIVSEETGDPACVPSSPAAQVRVCIGKVVSPDGGSGAEGGGSQILTTCEGACGERGMTCDHGEILGRRVASQHPLRAGDVAVCNPPASSRCPEQE